MKRKSLIAISCIISPLILGVLVTYVTPMSTRSVSAETVIKAVSDVSELGDPVTMPDVRNSTFKVAIYVEDTNLTSNMDLYGFDIQFNWTTQWISYTGYTVTQPVEDYPAVQPPSPYAGILHADTMKLHEAIDESASIPLAEPGTMAWLAYSSMFPAPSFNGSGTICVFTFNVTDQPFNYEGSGNINIHFIVTFLSNSVPSPVIHTVQDLNIILHPRKFEIEYPPSPMLEVTPDFVTGYGINETFSLNITLLGADGLDLDAFWDVAGADFYLNFNATLIEAVDVGIDPDGDFGVFWADGTFELCDDIDNAEGWVHIAFMGLGATHNPVNGTIRIATINFTVTYESELYPEEPIDLENPLLDQIWYILNAESGVVDLSMPVTTEWLTVFPVSRHGLGFNLTDWEDVDGDGELSVGDQVILLNKDTLKWYDYYVDSVQVTLNLTQQAFPAVDDYVWAASFGPDNLEDNGLPGEFVGTDDPYDGFGTPDWTGNFTVTYPVESVNQINATHFPFTPDNYTVTLTEGVDYIVHPDDDLIELLVPQDDYVTNECWTDGVNNSLNGWPGINYVASGIESVYVDMHNGTTRYGRNYGYAEEPPSEWWFDPDWTWELEGWYALGYYEGPYNWPVNSTWWINYTAASYLTIDYNADPDPRPYYVEFDGTLDEFAALTDPYCTWWHEAYPDYSNMWHCISHDTITIGNMMTLNFSGLIREYQINDISTDITVIQKPCVQDKIPGDYYYTDPIIVEIAGFAHPERPYSPWYGRNDAVRLPNTVENSAFKAIPEFNGLLALLPLLLATVAVVTRRKLSKKK